MVCKCLEAVFYTFSARGCTGNTGQEKEGKNPIPVGLNYINNLKH